MSTIFKIEHKSGKDYLNTINTLSFKIDSTVFLSGTRDGYLQLYDMRDTRKEIFSVNEKKYNTFD